MKPIAGWPSYFVDESGRVWTTRAWRSSPEGTLREMHPSIGSHGYRNATLCRGTEKQTFTIHSLIAATFLAPSLPGQEHLRHLDGNKLNNASTNLAWGTRQENAADSFRHGTAACGSRSNLAKLDDDTVLAILAEVRGGAHPTSVAKKYGISRQTAARIGRGETWAHLTRRAA